MNLYFALLLIIVGAKFGVSQEWSLIWEENFDGKNNLKDRWYFETGCGGWGNMELECYTDGENLNAVQENGKLVITAKAENDGTTITSARLSTKQSWQYGKFVMRARLPKGKHLWPAFWMMPKSSLQYGSWPRSGEIDIMEYRGQKPNEICGTLHFGKSREEQRIWGSGETKFPFDFSEAFHEFGFVWNSTGMWWFVDDMLYHNQSLQMNMFERFYEKEGQPFQNPFFILVNLAVGGNFFKNETFQLAEVSMWTKPSYEIDWIRIWQKKIEHKNGVV